MRRIPQTTVQRRVQSRYRAQRGGWFTDVSCKSAFYRIGPTGVRTDWCSTLFRLATSDFVSLCQVVRMASLVRASLKFNAR